MPTLSEQLLSPENRPKVVADCARLVESEVAAKGGLSGLAVKGAFAVVQKLRPDFTRHAVEALVDEFVQKLEPFYSEFTQKAQGQPLAPFIQARSVAVASALLAVTDSRVARIDQAAVKGAYERLRPTAQKHVETAIPAIVSMVSKYAK